MSNDSWSPTSTNSSRYSKWIDWGTTSSPIPSTRYGTAGGDRFVRKVGPRTDPFGSTATIRTPGTVLLEVPTDPAHRAARTDRSDHGSETRPAVPVDLGAGGAVVRLRVPLIHVLIGVERPRDLSGESGGHRVVAERMLRGHPARGHDHPGTVRLQQPDLLRAHLVGDDEHRPVAAHRGDDREPDPGVPARRLDDRPPGLRAGRPAPLRRPSRGPIRSLTDPPGLRNSSLTRIRYGRSEPTRRSGTTGVFPMRSSTDSTRGGRHGRRERDTELNPSGAERLRNTEGWSRTNPSVRIRHIP